jgi:Tfp pilus assembly protein PilF
MARRLLVISLIILAATLAACATPPEKRQLALSHQELGNQMLREGDFIGAMRELLEAAEIDPDNAQTQLSLAYRNRGLNPEAEKSLHRALSLDRNDAEIHQTLGALLVQMHRYDEAIPELTFAIKDLRYATPHLAYTNLGNAYLGKNQPPQAIESFRHALETAPNFVFAHRGIGDANYLLGRFDEAANSYRAALLYYSSDGDSQVGLGLCLARLGRVREARTAFQATLDVAPGTDAANRARLYLDRLERGVSLDPEGGVR